MISSLKYGKKYFPYEDIFDKSKGGFTIVEFAANFEYAVIFCDRSV